MKVLYCGSKVDLIKYLVFFVPQVGIVHSDEVLHDDFTLMDVAYIYGWRRLVPLKLYFMVVDRSKLPPPAAPETEPAITEDIKDIKPGMALTKDIEPSITKIKDIEIPDSTTNQDSGIAAMVVVPKDDNKENSVEISVSEDCSDQAMDLSIPQKRDSNRSESVITISSSTTNTSKSGNDTESENEDSMNNEIEAAVRNEILGYKTQALSNPMSVPSVPQKDTESKTVTEKTESPLKKSGLLNKPTDETLQKTISSILEVLSNDTAKSDGEDNSVEDSNVEEPMDTSANDIDNSVVSEGTAKPMDTTEDAQKDKDIEQPDNELDNTTSDQDNSSDDLPKLVIIEPQKLKVDEPQKWKVERCESVHSDKENQSISPTIVDIIPVNSNLPKVEMIEKFEKKEESEAPKVVPTQCSVVVPQTQVPQPVYTVHTMPQQSLLASKLSAPSSKPAKLSNSPSSGDPKKRGNVENVIENIVKRKRGRPPKVPKDPATCTPPKIARILPKGVPPQNFGFIPNGMNMPQGAYGMPMQFPTANHTVANGQVVRVFVQNVQNTGAGQTGGQMMVNGQPQQQQQQMNMQQQGMNTQQFMNQPQGMMNTQPMMAPQQFQIPNQQQQQQQQMPNNMNMTAMNIGSNQIQMMPGNQSSMLKPDPGGQDSGMGAVNQNGTAVHVVGSNQAQAMQGTMGAAGSLNQMAQFCQQQVPTGSGSQSNRSVMQPGIPVPAGGQQINTQQSASSTGLPTTQGALNPTNIPVRSNPQTYIPVRSNPPTNIPVRSNPPKISNSLFNRQKFPQFSRLMNAPLVGRRQPGYPPAPRMPSLPQSYISNSPTQHKTVKLEKCGPVTSTCSSLSSSISSVPTPVTAAHAQTSLPSTTSTGLNNGYDAPLELTTKKETPALQKLASMQPS